MRRAATFVLPAMLLMASIPALAQQEPPQGPIFEPLPLRAPLDLLLSPAPLPQQDLAKPAFDGPEKVFISGSTSVAVVLDSPLSTRITKKGQEVVFLTSESIRLGDGIELPPDTRILATVLEAKKPGAFGRPGGMKIKIERIEVESESAAIVARLEGVDANAGKIKSDSNRTASLYSLASWSLTGVLIGAQSAGGKGALIGGGAGAAAAILLGMARKGPDLYLEPGTPFSIVIEEPVELQGSMVYSAQQKYAQTHAGRSRLSEDEMLDSASDPSKPKLQHRPKPPRP